MFESHHAPGFVMAPRRHAFVKVLFVIDGQGSLEIEGEPARFSAGDLMIVPPRVTNRLHDDPRRPPSLYGLCVARSLLRFDPGLIERLPKGRLPSSRIVAERAGALFRRLCFEQARGDATTPIAMVASALGVLRLAVDAGRTGGGDSATRNARQEVQRYAASLGERFYEAEGIDAVARRLGLSRRRFTGLFREVTGESWLRHTRRLAIDHAARLLAETDTPIAAVAFECGFSDLSTFYRRFKALRSVPPAEWRRRHRSA